MSVIADYANLYETEIRPRSRRLGRRRLDRRCLDRRRLDAGGLRYLGVLVVWGALFLARPRLALAIWRERA